MKTKNLMEYKGYYGSYELSEDDSVFFGKIEFIKDLISYEGETAEEVLNSFHEAIDDYLITCEKEGRTADKPFKGSFNVRIGEELHRQIAMEAIKNDESINSFVKKTLKDKVS